MEERVKQALKVINANGVDNTRWDIHTHDLESSTKRLYGTHYDHEIGNHLAIHTDEELRDDLLSKNATPDYSLSLEDEPTTQVFIYLI